MRALGYIISLLLAAAAGAATIYFLKLPPPPPLAPGGGPGNGAVTCPGNAACPSENRDLSGTRAFHGLIVPDAEIQSGRIQLCTGKAVGKCPKNYVGYLIRHIESVPPRPTDPKPIKHCDPSMTGPCKTNNVWALYCANAEKPKAPNSACDALPEISDPGYDP